MRGLLGSSIASIAVKGVAAVAGLTANVLIARALGPSGAGTYFLALTVLTVFAVVGRAGTDVAALKHVAAYLGRARSDLASVVVHASWSRLRTFAGLATAALAAFAWFGAAQAFGDGALTRPLLVMAAAVVPLAGIGLVAELLKAERRVVLGMIVQSLWIPATVATGLGLALVSGWSLAPVHVAIFYVVASTTGVLAGWRFHRRLIESTPVPARAARGDDAPAPESVDDASLGREANTYLAIAVQNLVLTTTDTIMLGLMAAPAEVGLFVVAMRVANIGSLALAAINSVVGPRFANYAGQGDREGLARLARTMTRFMAAVSLVLFGGLFAFRSEILGLFGPEFTAASTAFAILCLGQLVVLGTGPTAYLLMMTGHHAFHRTSLSVAAVANIVLNLVLIPWLGIVGAAIATAASHGVKNLITVGYVRVRLGFWVLP